MTHGKAERHNNIAERFAALNRVGIALMGERDESRLLHLIAETACDLTGASFAAFTLRPSDEEGQLLVPAEGNLFHLAEVVGVTKQQKELFRRMPLGGEGLLAPIFRYGVPVLVDDVSAHTPSSQQHDSDKNARDAARDAAFAFAHGTLPSDALRAIGQPHGHPTVHSFLGVPLLDHDKQVRGGLLLGHGEPGKFTLEDQTLLVGLTAQAMVALENARLYRTVQMRAQELDATFESIADGVILVDTHGNIVRENATARRLRTMLAHSNEGRHSLEELIHAPTQRVLQGEALHERTVRLLDERGEERTYSVTASPLRLPEAHAESLPEKERPAQELSGAVVVWHDVTEARRLIIERRIFAEAEVRRVLLQTILNELPGSVYLVRGRDARLVLANRACATVFGAHWPLGKPMSEFLEENGIRIFNIDGRRLVPEQFATLRAVQLGETIHYHQEIIRHSDGTTLPVLVNAVALSSAQFNLLPNSTEEQKEPAALVMHQDVTALKEAEALKDEFIGIAAHELRNPLAVLRGFAQTLIVQTARGNGAELADWQLEALEGIDQATLRLTELTEDLLDVTRLQAGRLELHVEPADLIALTQRVMKRAHITDEHHIITIHTPLEHLVAYLDSRRIEQVLTNIIGNAIKYSPAGGAIEITIRQEQATHLAILSVRDHGIGIPSNQQTRIFSRFTRADNARDHGIGGTGLGLYLCRELVERHHGRIWFESSEGQGSTFHFALPTVSTGVLEM